MLNDDQRLDLYHQLVRVRTFEKRTERYTMAGKFVGSIHLAVGQEAIAVGVAAVLRDDDVIGITYRGRGQALAKGVAPERIWAEMMGRAIGTSRGKGGPMHIGDPAKGVMTANAIVGAGIPIAAGTALAMRNRGLDSVAVAFFGEGATNQGVFSETVNMAALLRLPLVFVCESNQYAEMTKFSDESASANLVSRIAPYRFPTVEMDGNDIEAVIDTVGAAVERARRGDGPTFVDAQTYRLSGHMVGDSNSYRPAAEIDQAWLVEPIVRYRQVLVAAGLLDDDLDAEIAADVDSELAAAWAAAESSPLTDAGDAMTDAYAS